MGVSVHHPCMSSTSLSCQPRPQVLHVKPPLADTHISLELLANFFLGLIPLPDFSLPHKGLLCPKSIKQTKNTPSHVDWSHLKFQLPECPHLPWASALSHRCLLSPQGNLLNHPLQKLLLTSSSTLRPHHSPTSCILSAS